MIVTVESFFVIGIETRTTNAAEVSGNGAIPRLWARYLSRSPRTGNTYAVYSDYESDQHGAYSFLIGTRASATDSAGEGQVRRRVIAGQYRIFVSDRGPLPQVVPRVWQRIWPEATGRKYATDFELYDTRADNPSDGQVDVYIGLK